MEGVDVLVGGEGTLEGIWVGVPQAGGEGDEGSDVTVLTVRRPAHGPQDKDKTVSEQRRFSLIDPGSAPELLRLQHQLASTEEALRAALDQAQQVDKLVEAMRSWPDKAQVSTAMQGTAEPRGGPQSSVWRGADPSLKGETALPGQDMTSGGSQTQRGDGAGSGGPGSPSWWHWEDIATYWLCLELQLGCPTSPSHPTPQTISNSGSANGIHQPDKAQKQEVRCLGQCVCPLGRA
jgi:hypothetical protein